MNKYICTVFVFLLLFLNISMVHADQYDRYPFENSAQQQQFYDLIKDLRCLVCQNQDLLDSNAPLAEDLRDEIYDMVNDGQSNRVILTYLTNRYGDYILFQPPFNKITLLLWLGPFTLLLMAILILVIVIKQRNKMLAVSPQDEMRG